MEYCDLTTMLERYKKGNLLKNDLISAISIFVYRFPLKHYRWKEDECSDFYCYFYPKISRMIETFQLRDIPFEAYLTKTLKLQIKTFAAKKTADKIALKILRYREFWSYEYSNDSSCCLEKNYTDSNSPYSLPSTHNRSGFINCSNIANNKTIKRRILMLALKNINYLSEKDICDVIKISDCKEIWLNQAGKDLKTKISGRILQKEKLSEQRNRFFCKLYFLHENYSSEILPADKNEIFTKTIKVKSRIDNLTKRINRISDQPTHQDIARVMNIPKGSVDSGLFYLRLYLEKN